jgi:CRISPR/Cas system-associated exonuclease Cas4 (RecB family)
MKLIRSANAALRLNAAMRFIDSFPPSTEILVVGATRDAADDFAREASLRHGATFGLHRFSIAQLAAKLAAADLAGAGMAPSTSLGVEAIAARVVFESRQRRELTYVTPVTDLPGFARALAATASDLRLAGVEAGSLAPLPDPGRDLSLLLRRMEDCMAEGSVADRAILLRTAANSIGPGGPSESFVAGKPVLLLDVPVESAAEREFISSLARRASEMTATVPSGDDTAWRTLESLPGVELETLADEPAAPLDRLRARLFSPVIPSADPAPSEPRQVRFFSAPGEARECIEIARRILDEARTGAPFDRIAIVLRVPELYSGLLETALRRAGIPAFFSRGTRSPDPSGRAFIALLNCARESLSARRFAEYLSLAQVPSLDPSGGPPPDRGTWVASDDESLQAFAPGGAATEDPDVEPAAEVPDPESVPVLDGTLRAPWGWERLLVESAVIGGRDRWRRRLDGLRAEYRLKLEALAAEEAEAPRLKAVERDLQNLEHLRSFALPVIDELAAFPRQALWGEWLGKFERLAPRVLRRPHRVLALLAELRPMAAVGAVTLDEVCTVLSESLTMVRQPPPESRYGRVLVATPDQMRGRNFDVVFVPGLAERMFPQRIREDPLLLDGLRVRLEADLQTREQRSGHERLRLRLAAGAAKKAIWFSYPRMDLTESRPRVASFYALDIQHALTGSVPDIDALEQQAFEEGGARLAWPAPVDSRLAIDHVEYDLAVLGPLLRHPDPGFVRGRARYLLDLNTHLARSLKTRWARWHHPRWCSFDGLCGVDHAPPEVLAGYRLKVRPYSVSALQKFAACPYQFLLSAIHRLEPREEPVPLDQMDPLTRGHMFHRVQAELMRELKACGGLPVSPAVLARALRTLEQVLARVEAEYREELAPAIERVWRDEVETMRGDLRGWLHSVAAAGGDWQPVHFEYGFGLKALDNLDAESVDDPVTLDEGWLLHGVIDLIERKADSGGHRVTDHKTGGNWTRDGMVVGGGEVLQPVLYGLAVEKLLGPVTEARLSYCTSTGRFSERVVVLDEAARQSALKVLAIVDAAVEKGMLLPAPREGRCDWCDFRIVCGPHEEVRSGRKPPLPDLIRLREMP